MWLPLFPGVRIHRLTLDDGAAARQSPDRRPRWIHYRSSTSHCLEAGHPTGTSPAVTAQLFGEADLDHLPDGLHPDAEGYARIGARFAELVT